MKKSLLLIIILTLSSCASIFLNTALEKVGVFDDKAEIKIISNKKKNLAFIGMHHIGRPEFYNDVAKKTDSLQQLGYVVFYEATKKDLLNDSLSNDIYERKARKITGISNFKYYDTVNNIIGGRLKYKGDYKLINQPSYLEMKVNMKTAKNADVIFNSLIDNFEQKYGVVELSDCDKNTTVDSKEYNCDKIDKELADRFSEEFIVDFRNKNLAKEISDSEEKNILVIYGKNHLVGLMLELQKNDVNWKETVPTLNSSMP
ncbi:hypothetical protein LX97_03178 [Nonlabens dokdonensis]|uniref:Lipoprotein n=2 Tax=Nonlabens dokdonensis TaxID=328515 RepID=L7WDC3_NONDD|nr:hypothetical protein [Nonlabens dokdonensis]AGC78094.1 hypothetical protein DDD_2967 [Nonlabens dokdonensis DSW-6]PZX37156.1 hypothetical protein LX97_03178 [Nonlabens dokdonensis]